MRVDLVNWPDVKMSGLDLHFGQRVRAGPGQLSLALDGTWTAEYRTKASCGATWGFSRPLTPPGG